MFAVLDSDVESVGDCITVSLALEMVACFAITRDSGFPFPHLIVFTPTFIRRHELGAFDSFQYWTVAENLYIISNDGSGSGSIRVCCDPPSLNLTVVSLITNSTWPSYYSSGKVPAACGYNTTRIWFSGTPASGRVLYRVANSDMEQFTGTLCQDCILLGCSQGITRGDEQTIFVSAARPDARGEADMRAPLPAVAFLFNITFNGSEPPSISNVTYSDSRLPLSMVQLPTGQLHLAFSRGIGDSQNVISSILSPLDDGGLLYTTTNCMADIDAYEFYWVNARTPLSDLLKINLFLPTDFSVSIYPLTRPTPNADFGGSIATDLRSVAYAGGTAPHNFFFEAPWYAPDTWARRLVRTTPWGAAHLLISTSYLSPWPVVLSGPALSITGQQSCSGAFFSDEAVTLGSQALADGNRTTLSYYYNSTHSSTLLWTQSGLSGAISSAPWLTGPDGDPLWGTFSLPAGPGRLHQYFPASNFTYVSRTIGNSSFFLSESYLHEYEVSSNRRTQIFVIS